MPNGRPTYACSCGLLDFQLGKNAGCETLLYHPNLRALWPTSLQWGRDEIVIHAGYTFSSCNLAHMGIRTSANITAFITTNPGHGRAYILGDSHWYGVSHYVFIDTITRASLTWWCLSVPLLTPLFCWVALTAETRIPYSQCASPATKVAPGCVSQTTPAALQTS